MSMIRLEHENFVAAERLESVLRERLLNVVAADADAGGDQRSTTYVCSAAHEAALGGEEAAIARGRALKAGVMIIIEEAATCFQLTVCLQPHPSTQMIQHQSLMCFRKSKLPWNSGMFY